MSASTLTQLLIFLAVVPATLTPIMYALLPWWKSRLGKSLMVKSIGIAALVDLAAARRYLGPEYPGQEDIQFVVVLFIVAGIWGIFFQQLVARKQAREDLRQAKLNEQLETEEK